MKKNAKKVMVIEDNKHTRFLVHAILASLGYEVVEAEDGKIGMEKLSDSSTVEGLSAIFLDVLMPNLNGMDLLTWIKKQEILTGVPVLMLTTKDMAEDLIEGYGLGADYYIPKPFTKQQIQFGLDLLLNSDAALP
jgi:DNA-binding response OmpR family regulator